jgi:RNA polymerase sigma-70 factor (ECF subfamily)
MIFPASLPMLSLCSFCLSGGFPAEVLHNAGSPRNGSGAVRRGETPLMTSETPREGPPRPSDAELVARCAAGSRQAFQELTLRYYRPVCGFVLKRVGQPDLVEDLVQETFLEAFRALTTGGQPMLFSSWLFGIASNRCGKWFRRKRPALFPATEPPDTLAVPSALLAQEELEEQQLRLKSLESELAGLSPEVQKLLHLKHREGKTCEQIAAELGQPTGTVKSQLSRAYKTLRARLSRGTES